MNYIYNFFFKSRVLTMRCVSFDFTNSKCCCTVSQPTTRNCTLFQRCQSLENSHLRMDKALQLLFSQCLWTDRNRSVYYKPLSSFRKRHEINDTENSHYRFYTRLYTIFHFHKGYALLNIFKRRAEEMFL